jgi:hypothetical protein
VGAVLAGKYRIDGVLGVGGGGSGYIETVAGGAEGSSYTGPAATNVTMMQGVNAGNGKVVITY